MGFRVLTSVEPIERHEFHPDALFFFDFDGVIAEQCEEKLFRLSEVEGERTELVEIAERLGIHADLYDTQYLRHLVFQAIDAGLPKPHRPMIRFIRSLSDPYFIITARSGTDAVSRMMRLVARESLYPQEVFCLGRSSKADLLAKLRKEWPGRPFVFFDDSDKHITAALELDDPLLTVVQVTWPTCTANAESLRQGMYA